MVRQRSHRARGDRRGAFALLLSMGVGGLFAAAPTPASGSDVQPPPGWVSEAAEATILIDFERYPGPDGRLGTADDWPTPPCGPPPIAICYPLSDECASLGLRFTSGTLAQGDLFPGSDPHNHFLTSGPLDAALTIPVYRVAIDAYSAWNVLLYALDEAGGVLATDAISHPETGSGRFQFGRLEVVTEQPIRRVVVLPDGCAIGQPCDRILNLDNLTLGTTPPPTAPKVLTTCDAAALTAALVGGGRIEFACDGTLVVPELAIAADTVLDASGRQVTLSGNHLNRVLSVRRGVTLRLVHLTVAAGHARSTAGDPATAGLGGGIFGAEEATVSLTATRVTGNTADFSGGGIWNSAGGTLMIDRGTLAGNAAGSFGGGIFNAGALTVTRSTLHGNTVGYSGGGLLNAGVAILTNSTLSGNRSERFAGAIEAERGTLRIVHGTLVGNVAAGSGSGISSGPGGDVTLVNSVLANAGPGGNCAGPAAAWRDAGYNLASDSSCGLDPATGSRVDPHPRLGPLADHGGGTLTHAPQFGSPAIDAIPPARCPVGDDQRGVGRPQDGDGDGEPRCDIGAVERERASARRGGGGCLFLGAPGGIDPTLPGLVLTSVVYVLYRARGSRHGRAGVTGRFRPRPGR
ncbi:MAG: choice-of-anchor Q domain-containing protein [Candidatus Competibacteraceae bacterium]